MKKKKVIDIVDGTINENKDSFCRLCYNINNYCDEFPPEVIYKHLELLFEEIKENILKDRK